MTSCGTCWRCPIATWRRRWRRCGHRRRRSRPSAGVRVPGADGGAVGRGTVRGSPLAGEPLRDRLGSTPPSAGWAVSCGFVTACVPHRTRFHVSSHNEPPPVLFWCVFPGRTRSQRLRTVAQVQIEAELHQPVQMPVYQSIAARAAGIRDRGDRVRAIARHLGADHHTATRPSAGSGRSDCALARCCGC